MAGSLLDQTVRIKCPAATSAGLLCSSLLALRGQSVDPASDCPCLTQCIVAEHRAHCQRHALLSHAKAKKLTI